jgi:membrane protein DedA with SNARE-associated domain
MGSELIATATTAGLGGSVALGLLLPMEAGLPIPPPADLVMFAVGERVAAGAFPLWLAVVGLEAVAIAGTAILFFACRGPARALIARVGPRVGIDSNRLNRAGSFVAEHGQPALAFGRATPGLRTVTVLAAAASGLRASRALPALILGSSVFLQLHLVLGMLFGPLAHKAFNQAKAPAVIGFVTLVGVAAAVWLIRRGRRRGTQACAEALCPACIALGMLAEHHPGLATLTGRDDRSTEAINASGV